MLADQQVLTVSLLAQLFLRERSGLADVNRAYFERRLAADVHKEHVVPFQHVLKHLLAWEGSDGRSGRGRKQADVASVSL